MRVVAFVGDHLRHRYFLWQLERAVPVVHVYTQQREPEVPESVPTDALGELVAFHFRERRRVESLMFGDAEKYEPRARAHTRFEDLQGERLKQVVSAVVDDKPDLLLCFGTGILPHSIVGVPLQSWNMHGGLSPWFRGDATMFWPSYLLQPQFTGVTLHQMTERVDAGALVHQSGAVLVSGDGLHALAARTLLRGIEETVSVVKATVESGQFPTVAEQRQGGKVFSAKDWRPEMCKVIYETFGDKIADWYLSGALPQVLPNLYRSPYVPPND